MRLGLKFDLHNLINQIISFGYKSVTHDEPSREILKFIDSLSHVTVGSFIAVFLAFMFNILAGRILGPSEYGLFGIIQSTGMIIYIPMTFGITTAMVKYASGEKNIHNKSLIISTAYELTLVLILISSAIYLIFAQEMADAFRLNVEYLYYSIALAVLYVLYTLSTSTLRSLHNMKGYAKAQVILNMAIFLFFLLFILFGLKSFKAMTYSFYLSYIFVCIIIIISFAKTYIIFAADRALIKLLVTYGMFASLSGISYIIYTNIDKIFINRFMSIEDVGVYNAYYFSSINCMGLFASIFMSVFFPTVCMYQNKSGILKKLNSFVPLIILLGIPFVLISEYIILRLYGNNYPIDAPLMILFAITSILFLWYDMYVWLFNSAGKNGLKLTLSGTVMIAIFNIIFNIYLIPKYGLMGAIASTGIAYIIGMCVIYFMKDKIKGVID